MSALARLGIDLSLLDTLRPHSTTQEQTKDAFSFKWAKRDTYESDAVKANAKEWLYNRYCSGDPAQLDEWLAGGRKIVLDAGCGSGFSAALLFGDRLKDHDYLGVDISDAVAVCEERFAEFGFPGDFLQASILDMPIPDESVDIIFSEGVLHHTDDTGKAIENLSRKLKRRGRFLFYVYAKKATIREFTDDHIRSQIQTMTDEESWDALMPLTKLGIALGEAKCTLDVPDDIPFLGIKKGPMDLQRFFYWNIFKMYYRPELSLDEMNHINFDWFRPLNCHRQTPEEVRAFCECSQLGIEHMNVEKAGITVVARKT